MLQRALQSCRALILEPTPRDKNLALTLAQQLEAAAQALDESKRSDDPSSSSVESPSTTPLADTAGALPHPSAPPDDETPSEAPPKTPRQDKALKSTVRVSFEALNEVLYKSEELIEVEVQLRHHLDKLRDVVEELDQLQGQVPGLAPQTLRQITRPIVRNWTTSLDQLARDLNALTQRRTDLVATTSRLMLVPLKSALAEIPAVGRSVARERNKQLSFSLAIEDLQVDWRILPALREVALHLTRNAVYHGIEAPSARLAKGKPEAGLVSVGARRLANGHVEITVEDDGQGIDVDAVTSATIEKGLLDADQARQLSFQDRLLLSLRSGVSTAPSLDAISGRGLGLAIVADRVKTLGGTLTITSQPGVGTRFRIETPSSLGMLRGLLVRASDDLYVLPINGLQSAINLDEGRLERVGGQQALVCQYGTLSPVWLGELLNQGAFAPSETGVALLIRQADSHLALVVDELLDEREFLIKDMAELIGGLTYYAGATVIEDGCLVPVLSLDALRTHAISRLQTPDRGQSSVAQIQRAKRLLVAEDSMTTRLLLKHILEVAGYEVDTATNGMDAYLKLEDQTFDCVVSDIEMPGMDGISLTQRIRRNPQLAELPVILVSALKSDDDKRRGMDAGANAYVVKSAFDQDNLIRTIQRLC